LLSPAGSPEALRRAIHAGADAVYLGGRSFGARAFAANFSYDELEQAIGYAHTYGVRVYVTVNTLIYQNETQAFFEHVDKVCALGADALIMQDAGMLARVRQRWPDMQIHASTQMHNHNDAALEYVRGLGAVRAVLAREMSIEQIKRLESPIEKEVFVHGALCIASSGQCLLSALTQGRSGNRGSCAQSCRMRYRLLDGRGMQIPVKGRYLLSPKDIAVLEDVNALLDAGVSGFKIEGRMKSPEYVGLVTRVYAALLEDIRSGREPKVPAEALEDLRKLFNRGLTKGHLLGDKGDALMSIKRPNHAGVPLGKVISAGKDGIRIKLAAPLRQGDGVKFEASDDGFFCNRIVKEGLLVSGAQPGDLVTLEGRADTRAGDTVVKTSDTELAERLARCPERKVPVTGKLEVRVGHPIRLTVADEEGHHAEAAGERAEAGITRPATEAELRESVSKLGGTPYEFKALKVETDHHAFVAKSVLNALRRDAVQMLTEQRTRTRTIMPAEYRPPQFMPDKLPQTPVLHVLVRNAAQLQAVAELVNGDIYTEDPALFEQRRGTCPGLRLKTDRLEEQPEPMSDRRLLVTDHGGLHVYPGENDVVLDYTAAALNADALITYFASGARRIALSPEPSTGQTDEIMQAFKLIYGQLPPVEALVYARHELMAVKHCLISHALGAQGCARCTKERFSLQDDAGRIYPILTTKRCENRLFEGHAAQRDVRELLDIGVRHFRVELFDEDVKESRKIVNGYQRLLSDSN